MACCGIPALKDYCKADISDQPRSLRFPTCQFFQKTRRHYIPRKRCNNRYPNIRFELFNSWSEWTLWGKLHLSPTPCLLLSKDMNDGNGRGMVMARFAEDEELLETIISFP